MFTSIFLLFAVAARLCAAVPLVTVGNTIITGTQTSAQVEFFGGIPFAQPPLGTLRFAPPVLQPSPTTPTLNATSFGFACLQNTLPRVLVSEDCLTLNVFRPVGTTEISKLPVMVWIHGGSFRFGTGAQYDATNLTSVSITRGTPIVFVSINYRLGPLGFAQGSEAASAGALNLGLKDQLVALEWVKRNAGAFGGDGSKVTVFGESAGAGSIDIHLLRPEITRLVRASIIESTFSMVFKQPTTFEPFFLAYVSAVPSCASSTAPGQALPCLRNTTTDELYHGLFTPAIPAGVNIFFPVIDGPGGLIERPPTQTVPAARFPVMIGSNLDEGTLFTNQQTDSEDDIRQALTLTISGPQKDPQDVQDAIDEILSLYPDIPALGSPIGTGNETFGLSSQYKRAATIGNDGSFHSRRRQFTQLRARLGVKTFVYHFTDHDALLPSNLLDPSVKPGSLGVAHATEISYVFNGPFNRTAGAVKLSDAMSNYWISFASSLTPNDGKGVSRILWPKYTSSNQLLIQLDGSNTTVVPDTYRARQIGFFIGNPVFAT